MKDKIVVEKEWFVQLIASLLMTCACFKSFLTSIWNIPLMVVLVMFANMYVNAVSIGYKLKSKSLKLAWCFDPLGNIITKNS